MIHDLKINILVRTIFCIALAGMLVVICVTLANGFGQDNAKVASARKEAKTTQPLYSVYKGVHIGTSTEDVRKKLGAPARKSDDQDVYVISGKETAQIFYDASHKVIAISVDYFGDGSGAPDYRGVVGPDIETKPDGSMYKLVRYEKAGFWVSYSRTAGNAYVVTLTIKNLKW
jgi:hypothetical protein